MTIAKRDVMFMSGETFAAAWLFLPEAAGSDAPVPAVAAPTSVPAVVATPSATPGGPTGRPSRCGRCWPGAHLARAASRG